MGIPSGIIRLMQPDDFDDLFQINDASTPGVSKESRPDFQDILSLGKCFVFERAEGDVVGFVNLIEPGTSAYQSLNLRWLEDWQAREGCSQIYVDRIALTPDARGRKIGENLYAFVQAEFSDRDFITAEVNTKPDNPGSHRFHQRLGFQRVGEQEFTPEKAVAYYALPLKR